MELGYHHVSRSTPDLERALTFYLALGCTLEKRVKDESQRLERAVLRLPGSDARLQLIEREAEPAALPAPDWPDHLAFHTVGFDAALERLRSAGGRLVREPYRLRADGGRIAFVLDPDGHQLELVEKPA